MTAPCSGPWRKPASEIHVHYEQQPEYKLTKVEKKSEKLDYRVTKLKLSKVKTTLIYNQFLTLSGIPKETYEYRLGNRSAPEWVINQHQVSTYTRSGITNDPNRSDDPTTYFGLSDRSSPLTWKPSRSSVRYRSSASSTSRREKNGALFVRRRTAGAGISALR